MLAIIITQRLFSYTMRYSIRLVAKNNLIHKLPDIVAERQALSAKSWFIHFSGGLHPTTHDKDDASGLASKGKLIGHEKRQKRI